MVPVDLNAVLCRAERLLAAFHRALGEAGPGGRRGGGRGRQPRGRLGLTARLASAGNSSQAARFQAAHEARVAAVQAVLWDARAGVWLDYHLCRRRHNAAFYPSNLSPLWAECAAEPDAAAERALGYLQVSEPRRRRATDSGCAGSGLLRRASRGLLLQGLPCPHRHPHPVPLAAGAPPSQTRPQPERPVGFATLHRPAGACPGGCLWRPSGKCPTEGTDTNQAEPVRGGRAAAEASLQLWSVGLARLPPFLAAPLSAACCPQGSSALSFTNGLPTSLARTGQQWDFPNAWAPLQQMVIAGKGSASSRGGGVPHCSARGVGTT